MPSHPPPAPAHAAPGPPLLEAVPNLSDGRRGDVFRRLLDAVSLDAEGGAADGVDDGVVVLDASSDPDHDRSVLTLAGPRPALLDALVDLYAVALEEIDLQRPAPGPPGVHPRLGAVDVTPLVPLGPVAGRPGTTLADAVDAAHELGRRVAERFDLPVFFYEAAARRPERRALAAVRRGGFEALERRLAEPDGAPDLGPRRPHPRGGATVIGARELLVAYNVVLASDDLDLARSIAAAVREAGGGLPGVRALGLPLASRGRVQVSMNLVAVERTSPWRAVDAVARAAAAAGVEVEESELIGLMPRRAAERSLLDAGLAAPGEALSPAGLTALGDALGLVGGLGPERLVETRLEAALGGRIEPG